LRKGYEGGDAASPYEAEMKEAREARESKREGREALVAEMLLAPRSLQRSGL